ncbi:MAG: hypothetical protein NC548_34855 [Lachnospiraceae bacterium]|nr:hypothetical protein [Lachnospiraceae bacterium]
MNNIEGSKRTTSARQPDVPGITLDTAGSTQKIVEQMLPSVTQEGSEKRVSMGSGKAIVLEQPEIAPGRAVADISEMVQTTGGFQTEEDEENAEVIDKVSLEKEILGPGGPFEQWVEEEKAEAQKWVNKVNKKFAEEADKKANEEALRQAGENPNDDEEEKEIMAEQGEMNTNENVTVKHAEIDRDDTPVVINTEDTVKAEESEIEEIQEKKEVPFYEAMRQRGVDVAPAGEDLSDLELPNDDELNFGDANDESPVEHESIPGEQVTEDTAVEETPAIAKDVYEEKEPIVKNVTTKTDNTTEKDDDGVYETSRNIQNKFVSYSLNPDLLDSEEEKMAKSEDTPGDDQRLEEFRSEISQRLKRAGKKLDLTGFTVASKATASNAIFEVSEVSAGKWPLPNTGICVEMRAINGQKVEELRLNIERPNSTTLRNRLRILYDAIVTPKPQSFEVWLRSISYADYDHLFMPAYIAAFNGANYMPGTCDKDDPNIRGCGRMFLSDDMNIMKLVKFTSEEAKAKFWALYDSDRTNGSGLYMTEIMPISDRFAIGFRDPSLYSVLFEYTNLNREFTQKYADTIQMMPYIDNIYWIDQANMKLVKIKWNEDPNNASKTTKAKVMKYHNVFGSLSDDEYSSIGAIIAAIRTRVDWMTYQIPEMTCPECGKVIPASESTAAALVFTRHQLGLLANTSIK